MPRRASPARARAGGIVCKKSQLKNFSDMKTAGGCGVVRFWSKHEFMRQIHSAKVEYVNEIL
ncbi:hypothetical protein FDX11_12570 [Citrobacter sp. wls714]|nr:hypothetical protein FDX11_12570 [Citrobacter sp. wls714]